MRNLPDKMMIRIEDELNKWFDSTLEGRLKTHQDLPLLKVIYRNGALDMYCEILKDSEVNTDEHNDS